MRIRLDTVPPGKKVKIIADNFVIATGSHPREHPTLKIDGKRIVIKATGETDLQKSAVDIYNLQNVILQF